jgi:preprotein translocase subunit SecG
MIAFLTAVHVVVALVLILVVLLQSARGTDLAGAFGGMGSQTAFGPRGTTTFLSKTTAVLAVIFMVTSLTLAILSSRIHGTGGSILSGEKPASQTPPATQPAAPTAPAVNVPGLPPGVQVHTEAVPVTAPPASTGKAPPAQPPAPPPQPPSGEAPAAPASPPGQ